MAINPESEFPGKITPSTTEYPFGSARNVTVPGDSTGTPWIAALVNDLFGFQQALLSLAGAVPSGTPDNATTSQYLDAVLSVIGTRAYNTIALMVADESLKSGNKILTFDNNRFETWGIAVSGDVVLDNGLFATRTQNRVYSTLATLKADASLNVGETAFTFFVGNEKGKNTRQLYRIMSITAATNGPLTDDSQIIPLDSGLFAVAVQSLGDSNIPFSLTRFNMHFGALKGIPWNASEPGGTIEFTTNSLAAVGDMSLSLASATSLVPNMLICYLADNGQYYTTVIESITVNVLALRTPIEAAIASSSRVFNFYNNSSHANQRGYYAITDYALRDIKYNLARVVSVPVTDWIKLNGPETVSSSVVEDIFAPGSADVPYVKVVTTAATDGAVTIGSYSLPQGQYLIRGFINPGATNSASLVVLETPGISGSEIQVAIKTLEGDDTTQVFELIYYARNNSTQRIGVRAVGIGAQEMEIGVVEIFKIDGLSTNPDNSKHVMLGDSWFDQLHIQARITDRLPNAVIFEEGFGGDRAIDLVTRFNADVTPHKPDYVWVMSGTNDYLQNETLDEFDFAMNVLKNKIASIGAIPMFFDSSVGEIDGPNAANFNRSRQYANFGSYNLEALRLAPDAPAPDAPTRVSFYVDAVSVGATSTKLVYVPPGTSTVEYEITRSRFTSGIVNVEAGFTTGIGVPTEDVQSFLSDTLVQPGSSITITKATSDARFIAIALENPSGGAIVVSGYIEILYIPTV